MSGLKGKPLEFYDKQQFIVDIDGHEYAGFTTCGEVGGKIDIIKHREGGDKEEIKQDGNVTYDPLTLTRGLSHNRELYDWWDGVRKGTLRGEAKYKTVRVIQRDPGGVEQILFKLYKALPADLKIGGWDKSSTDMNIESLTLEYQSFDRTDS